jgi:hypothetical protein
MAQSNDMKTRYYTILPEDLWKYKFSRSLTAGNSPDWLFDEHAMKRNAAFGITGEITSDLKLEKSDTPRTVKIRQRRSRRQDFEKKNNNKKLEPEKEGTKKMREHEKERKEQALKKIHSRSTLAEKSDIQRTKEVSKQKCSCKDDLKKKDSDKKLDELEKKNNKNNRALEKKRAEQDLKKVGNLVEKSDIQRTKEVYEQKGSRRPDLKKKDNDTELDEFLKNSKKNRALKKRRSEQRLALKNMHSHKKVESASDMSSRRIDYV